MRKINKCGEPQKLTAWKRGNPSGRYADLQEPERQAIRTHCASEQMYLCAYCCKTINGDSTDTVNEHVEPRSVAPNKELDINNIVASCSTKGQCDDSHKAKIIPLTPLMSACENELRFSVSGRVEGLTDRAKSSIAILNLGGHERDNKKLVEMRKQLINSLLFQNGVDPSQGLEDKELLEMVINDIEKPESGRLQPFAPIVRNILEQWIS